MFWILYKAIYWLLLQKIFYYTISTFCVAKWRWFYREVENVANMVF